MSIEKNTSNFLRHEELAFTTIVNNSINSIHHTGALGVYCYLASKPSGWIINKQELQNHFNCGRDHINTCWSYLRKIGAIELKNYRNEIGQIIRWETILKRTFIPQEIPESEIPSSGDEPAPDKGFTHKTGFLNSCNPAPINNIYIQNKEYTTTTSEPISDEPFFSSSTNNFFDDYKNQELQSLEAAEEETKKEALQKRFEEQCLNDKTCKDIYETRFKGLDVSLKELYEACADYWRQTNQLVYKDRFISHLKRCPLERYFPISVVSPGETRKSENPALDEIKEFNRMFSEASNEVKEARRINSTANFNKILSLLGSQRAVRY